MAKKENDQVKEKEVGAMNPPEDTGVENQNAAEDVAETGEKGEEKAAKASSAGGSDKTDLFKQHIQRIIYQKLGVKVSKDKAWDLFKAMIHGTVEHVIHLDDKKLSLSGVGSFEILETSPRGSKAGLDKDNNPIEGAEVWSCVPRFRFYPSSTIHARVEKSYGLGNHDDLKEQHYGLYSEEEPEGKKEPAKKDAKKVDKPEAKKKSNEKKEPAKKDGFDELDEL